MQQKVISRVAVLLVALAIGLAGWDVVQVSAQTATPPSTTNLQSVLQSLGATAQQSTSGIPAPSAPVMVQPSVSPSAQTIAPATPPTASQMPPSTLELLYSQRAGQPLQ